MADPKDAMTHDGFAEDLQTTSQNKMATNWVSIALTHVEYLEGDSLGKLLALSSLAPLGLLISFVTLITFRRDLHTISFFCGTILNIVIGWVLKNTIKEPRPSRGTEVFFTEYGMPSSHSQFMLFFATYVALFLLLRLHHCSNSTFMDNAWKYVSIMVFYIGAFIVSYSRVYLEYHTIEQVVWGGFIGALFAVIWFLVTQHFLTPIFPTIASWPISEMFMIKDVSLIPNVMWFEYTTHRTEARTRSRKLVSMKSK